MGVGLGVRCMVPPRYPRGAMTVADSRRPPFDVVAGSDGARAIGVVLTGSGIDGATGLRAIKGTGGTTVVQDPSTAAHRSMPQAAIATGCVDHVLALDEIGPALSRMAGPAPTTTVKARR